MHVNVDEGKIEIDITDSSIGYYLLSYLRGTLSYLATKIKTWKEEIR